ncbi:MAG: nucleotide exchange factor GrpE [Firmicutes bacterium]|nr:nucleotide exchange factor GrpE [Bacillota bacterium]
MSKEMEKELEKDQVTPEQEEPAQEAAEAEEAEASGAEEVAATQEDEDMKTKYLRLAADFQNFKRRTEKEKSDIYAYANEKFALDLLDVIDNFERALVHQDDCKDEKMKEGMELIFKQLQGVLEKNKITEIPALGEDFDPNVHNAVMTNASEDYESGKVSAVLQKGYKLNNKVIRPAMVMVAE